MENTDRESLFGDIKPEPRQLTGAEIEAGRTPKGGFTRKQLAEWGVSWPPPRGWRRALILGCAIEDLPPAEPADTAESHPDSIEAKLLHQVVMAVINARQNKLLCDLEDVNAYYNCQLPTVEDVVGGRPENAVITGEIAWEDKVYSFQCARAVRPRGC